MLAVDDSDILHWIFGLAAIVVPSAITTIVMAARKLIAYAKPKINEIFAENVNLLRTMQSHIPIVSGTLQKLEQGQANHSEMLAKHGNKIDEILVIIRPGDKL